MSVDVSKLQKTVASLENRAKNVAVVYPIIAGFCFFVLSWVIMAENARYLDRVLFVLLGAIFGRRFGTEARVVLEERKALLEGYLDLHQEINKPAVVVPVAVTEPVQEEQKAPVAIPVTASEAVEKVEIPAADNLPNIPSFAVPADVKDALNGKGKSTKVAIKKKPKT